MPQIYLGSNTVSAIYLGEQEVCDAFLGSTQAWDNCGFTPTSVTLAITNNISGPSAGYYFTGDLAGASRSGQPGVGTYAFSTSVVARSGYAFSSGPSVNNASGTFPTTNQTVYTTVSGTIATDPPNPSYTVTCQSQVGSCSSSMVEGNNTQIQINGSSSPQSVSGTAGTPYSFTITVSPIGEHNLTGVTIGGVAGTSRTITGTIPQGGASLSFDVCGTANVNTYSITYTLVNNITGRANADTKGMYGALSFPANNSTQFVTLTYPYGTVVNLNAQSTANQGYYFSSSDPFTKNVPGNVTFTSTLGNQTGTVSGTVLQTVSPCANATNAFYASVGEPSLNSFCSISTQSVSLFYTDASGLPGSGDIVCQGSGSNKSLVNGGNDYFITGTSSFNYSGTGSFTYMRLNTSGTVTASGSWYCY